MNFNRLLTTLKYVCIFNVLLMIAITAAVCYILCYVIRVV